MLTWSIGISMHFNAIKWATGLFKTAQLIDRHFKPHKEVVESKSIFCAVALLVKETHRVNTKVCLNTAAFVHKWLRPTCDQKI